ncbi:MAG: phosphoribosylglycinamide formyltransferase [Defluviitaleaceae bacterium]|nr:phosphoribosylglycinamide formyltransferase [Defluviitaleaceae bacterium]MCL2835876.1 phosphoribosylglycinamide formyltransferase [Defluviitaleaceae bacterium]
MLRIAVLCSGGGTNLQALIDASCAGELCAEIALVIASKPGIYALRRAADNGLPSVVVRKRDYREPGAFEAMLAGILNGNGIGLAVLAGWTVILDGSFLRSFNGKTINIHPALLPSFGGKGFYGLKVHEAALAAGVKVTGATVHMVTDEVDGGPILLQKAVAVKGGDTPETLRKRVMEEAERVLIAEAVNIFARGDI